VAEAPHPPREVVDSGGGHERDRMVFQSRLDGQRRVYSNIDLSTILVQACFARRLACHFNKDRYDRLSVIVSEVDFVGMSGWTRPHRG
jgi:hypothetical protein